MFMKAKFLKKVVSPAIQQKLRVDCALTLKTKSLRASLLTENKVKSKSKNVFFLDLLLQSPFSFFDALFNLYIKFCKNYMQTNNNKTDIKVNLIFCDQLYHVLFSAKLFNVYCLRRLIV